MRNVKDRYQIIFEEKINHVLGIIPTFFQSGSDISVSLIQRKCQCGYIVASSILKQLIKDGLVEPLKESSEITKMK